MNNPYRFDLEKALATWRRTLVYNRAFMAEDLDELERHLRDQVSALVKEGIAEKEAFRCALQEMGDYGAVEAEYRKVYWGKRRRRRELSHELLWRFSMLKNYLKIALRNARRHPGYSAINVGGLAIGMACCLLIALYVHEELSYDRHHPAYERVYRIANDIQTATGNRVFANGPATLAAALEQTYPQVEETVRLWKRSNRLVVRDPERQFYEDNFFFADPSVFNLFALPLAQGDPETALAQPATVVISARVVARYFGEEDPLGQMLTINGRDYEVTGVLDEPRHNSHITFDFISSILPVEERNAFFQNWHLTMFHTYVRLQENTDAAQFDAELATLAERYVADDLRAFRQQYVYFLQPIAQIHLHSQLRGEIAPPGNALYIYIFSVVAVLILLIASLNYINLTTAQSATRAKEVGVRKVVGSHRGQLVQQFLGESVILAVVALGLALGLVILAFPWVNTVTGYRMGVGDLLQPTVLAGMGLLLVLVGGLAGFFPALVLSALKPIHILKGRFRSSRRGALLRKVLVTGQFAISLILIVGSVTAFEQLTFMKDSSLGFDEEQMLILPIRVSIADTYTQFKTELLRDPAIRAATASSYVPGRGADNFAIELVGEDDPKNQSMYYFFVDFDFLSTYGLEIMAGRGLQRDLITDQENAFLINEAGLSAFGWQTAEEALGKRVRTGLGGMSGDIVGVYRDFNYRSLHTDVEPLMLTFVPPRFSFLSLKLGTADLPATLAHIERTWRQFIPQRPFEYFFLDEDFNRQYRADEKTALLMLIFAGLAIIIACLGLFGLAAFSAQAYTKEIGIRKVLGASVGSIVVLLTRGFARLVLVAVVIGTPVAWFAVHRWLETFAHHIELSWWIFLMTGLMALGVALLTASYQAVKAALADPVKSLRYE